MSDDNVKLIVSPVFLHACGFVDLTRIASFVIICYRFMAKISPQKTASMTQGKWLTIDELAEYLKMGRTKLYRMAQDGGIPASKVGSQWRFDRDEIDEWMRHQRPAASDRKTEGGA